MILHPGNELDEMYNCVAGVEMCAVVDYSSFWTERLKLQTNEELNLKFSD